MKATVLDSRNVGIRPKKRRFLKLIRIFVGIKNNYYSDYQHLSHNTKNKRFCQPKDNTSANIDCICGQNSLFVNFLLFITKRKNVKSQDLLYKKENSSGLLRGKSIIFAE